MTGVSFRRAAFVGDVAAMRSLLGSVQIEEAGPKTKMTAAHQAAVKGHANVLRFLHSLGDTFSKVNNEGELPEQMAKDPECKRVFELAALARRTLEVVDKVFPERVDVNQPGGLSEQFQKFRDKSVELIFRDLSKPLLTLINSAFTEAEKASAAQQVRLEAILTQWQKMHCEPFALQYETLATLKLAKKLALQGGACGETSSIAFGYLAYVLKTDYRVERLLVSNESGNHAFVILNRDPNSQHNFGLDNALVIDAYMRQSFFCGNFGDVNTTIDVGSLNQKSILCSSVRPPVPEAPWSQNRTITIMNDIYTRIAKETAEAFTDWGITEERGQ